VRRRLDSLHDEPRPGELRTIGAADVERMITKIRNTVALHPISSEVAVVLCVDEKSQI